MRLCAGLSAVVATLRLQFAQTITLGISLGDIFSRAADQGGSTCLCAVTDLCRNCLLSWAVQTLYLFRVRHGA